MEQASINIALAVATDRGLYNPVIKDCGGLSLKEISRRAQDLADKAHQGNLSPEDLEGGTFTLSNMGMLGVESFSAIITPPQAAVLAVGTVKGEIVINEHGEPVIAPDAAPDPFGRSSDSRRCRCRRISGYREELSGSAGDAAQL